MVRLEKFKCILIIIFVCCNMALISFWKYNFNYKFENINKKEIVNNTKLILYWSPFWHKKAYYLGYGFEPFRNCIYKNCYATADRHTTPVENFDALIFHATYSKQMYGVPLTRKPHQIYILLNMEAPVYECPDLNVYMSFFNWTMSYRFDSDILMRYGFFFKQQTNYTTLSKDTLKRKTKLVAWFVSNCTTTSKREVLTKNIQKYIPVDVFGSCGKLNCKRHVRTMFPTGCYEMVEKNYKFYFSFENSYCRDYSTEKLYDVLQKNVLPVVYGADDYRISAPPNSVINVADFETVEELVKYLKFLDANDEEYLKYFEWKKQYTLSTSFIPVACQICQKLHEPIKQSIYYNLYEWWWGPNRSVCKTDQNLPKIVSDLL